MERLADPEGKTSLTSKWRVFGQNGRISTSLLVSYDAVAGERKLEARDAAGGMTTPTAFTVKSIFRGMK